MAAGVGNDVDAGWVGNLDHRDETALDLLVAEGEQVALATGDVRRPCAGEAVGLLLGVDGGEAEVEHAGPCLDGVAVLVCGDHTDGGGAEVGDEVRQEERVVVHDDVAAGGVERVALDVAVADRTVAALRQVFALGVVGEDAGDGLERRTERGLEVVGPELGDVDERRVEEVVVVLGRFRGAEVDDLLIGRGRGRGVLGGVEGVVRIGVQRLRVRRFGGHGDLVRTCRGDPLVGVAAGGERHERDGGQDECTPTTTGHSAEHTQRMREHMARSGSKDEWPTDPTPPTATRSSRCSRSRAGSSSATNVSGAC